MTTSTATLPAQPRVDESARLYRFTIDGVKEPVYARGRLKLIPHHVMIMEGNVCVWGAPSESVLFYEADLG